MFTRFLINIVFLLFTHSVTAQHYDKYMQQGKLFFNESNYIAALERFDLAFEFANNRSQKDEAKNWKINSREKIKKQQEQLKREKLFSDSLAHLALEHKKNAEQEKEKVQAALIVAKEMQLKAEQEKEKAEKVDSINKKIINSMYWVGDNLALTSDRHGRLGFIDRNGNLVIKPMFNKLLDIDFFGFALVQINRNPLLKQKKERGIVDGEGRIYGLAKKSGKINQDRTAFFKTTWLLNEKLFDRNIKKQLFPYNIKKIVKHENLEVVIIQYCKIKKLPKEINQLINLTFLNLLGNNIITLPPEIENLTKLTQLNISRNKLEILPPELGNLTKLTKLDLSENNLTVLPPELGNLTNLTTLNLSENNVTALPLALGKLTNLTSLDLYSNSLSTLPPDIGNLTKLQYLDLSYNQLTFLPNEFRQLVNLSYLGLYGNNFSNSEKEKIKAWLPNCKIIFGDNNENRN